MSDKEIKGASGCGHYGDRKYPCVKCLRTKLASQEATIKELKDEVEETERERVEAQEGYDRAENDLSGLSNKFDTAEATIKELEKELEYLRKAIREIKLPERI